MAKLTTDPLKNVFGSGREIKRTSEQWARIHTARTHYETRASRREIDPFPTNADFTIYNNRGLRLPVAETLHLRQLMSGAWA